MLLLFILSIFISYVYDCQIGFFMEITLVNFPVHMSVHNSVKKTYLLMEYPQKKHGKLIISKFDWKICVCVCWRNQIKIAKSC